MKSLPSSPLVAATIAVAGALVLAVSSSSSCGPGCRAITTAPIALDCDFFTGELHFDDENTFRTFLEDDCSAEPVPDLETLVAAVDFSTDVAFVASGPRAEAGGRCVEKRGTDDVQVCDDGLRVYYDDEVSDAATCAGHWTVAFAMPRSEMRAALDLPRDDSQAF